MIDIGIAGLDTSHPETFASSIERRDDAAVAAVWDGGDVRDEAHVVAFCDRHGATLCADVEEMLPLVDAVAVLTVNWDTHAELAAPVLEAGVPTLVDKPVAGRLSDVEALAEAAESAPLFGGSSIPYHPALDGLASDSARRTLYCVGYNDPFYYGAHVVQAARHLADADWYSVTPAADPGATVDVLFENDAYATVRLDGRSPAENGGFGFLSVGDRTASALVGGDAASRERMYDRFLDAFVRAARTGTHDARPILDAASLLLAVHAALDEGRPITPDSPELREYRADGSEFAEEYARSR